ncbi:hypothetical protein E2C01_011911 [Portunus trituberculatus]|uniref:Uncharacterized protein n=1 Tax=Portunus trituberculatus TaxID=210409 RepID=A0A5B7DCJ7_PORTR|nr:hypothetical protein [Portunus trituberculatus]
MVVAPPTAEPMANPAIPCSQRGVLKTRSFPNLSCSPIVQRNTPPNPTSSPNMTETKEKYDQLFTYTAVIYSHEICTNLRLGEINE